MIASSAIRLQSSTGFPPPVAGPAAAGAGPGAGEDVDVVGGGPVENGEVMRAACSTITAIIWSVSGGSFQDFQ